MCVMALEAMKFNFFLNSLNLFIFFHPYLQFRLRGAQLVSGCVVTKIILLLYNTFPECVVNLTSNFNILSKGGCMFDIFFHSKSPPQSLCVQDCLESSTLLG